MCQKTTKTPPPTIDRFRGPYDFLSNFYPAKLRYEGLTYCNAEARQKLGRWEIGQARLTPGYGLRAAYVLHVIEPVYGRDPEALLAQCYAACLDLAQAHRFPETVFPPLATGKACFPKEKAARIAVESVRRWCKTHRGPVVFFFCADQRSFDCVRAALEEGAP